MTSSPTKIVQTFLNFNGRCEEALEFYRRVLGAEIDSLVRVKDSDDPGRRIPEAGDKIWYASFRIGETMILASDCRNAGSPDFRGFSLSLGFSTEAEAGACFAALSDHGEVEMPLQATSWSPYFGVVTDRFGLCWMICVLS